jgi:serine/threonine-protein kinase
MKKCLAKDRNRRYANAEEILREFETTAVVPGQVINGRYEILREIGEGGMGHVYEARDRDLDEVVALKMLKGEISGDPDVLQRFIREIKVARMIAHPNVVRVFDTATYETNRYITMEYINGIGLDRWIEQSKNIDLRTRVGILLKILQGVQAAHGRGIVHRDLKPQNILIDSDLNPHILDFGISRLRASGEGATTARLILGSPKYTSPEQINGQDADYRSDIYSLGVISFYMLTFQEPFAGDDVQAILMKHLTQEPPTLRQLNSEIPLWLEDIVLRALRKEPARRFENIEEMLGDLKFGLDFNHNS